MSDDYDDTYGDGPQEPPRGVEPQPADEVRLAVARSHHADCGYRFVKHDHGIACHSNCPTCGGRPWKP
jgi:hypothetical protein